MLKCPHCRVKMKVTKSPDRKKFFTERVESCSNCHDTYHFPVYFWPGVESTKTLEELEGWQKGIDAEFAQKQLTKP